MLCWDDSRGPEPLYVTVRGEGFAPVGVGPCTGGDVQFDAVGDSPAYNGPWSGCIDHTMLVVPVTQALFAAQLDDLTPTQATAGSTVSLTLTGAGFYGPLTVAIGSDEIDSAEATPTSPTSATAELELDADLTPGVYQMTLGNAGGCADTLDLAFEVLPAS